MYKYFTKTHKNKYSMKQIILLRHGLDDSTGNLSNNGERQIVEIGGLLLEIIEGKSLKLFSSPAPRVIQSAEILSLVFEEKAPIMLEEKLWSDRKHPYDLAWLYDLVERESPTVDVTILLSHMEYVELFPFYYASKKGKRGNICPKGDAENGDGFIIEEKENSINIFPLKLYPIG